MAAGACIGRPDDEWNDDDEGLAGQRRTSHAKWICTERCTVTSECLDYALTNKIKHGVWGGTSQDERKAILSHRHQLSLRSVRINVMPAKTSTHPPKPKPPTDKSRPKPTRAPSAPREAPQRVRVEGSDLDRLTTLRALITPDGSVHQSGRTPAEWLELVDFEGSDAEFVEWLELQGRAGALSQRPGDRLAIA